MLRRVIAQWWLIGLCAIVACLAAFAAAAAKPKLYESTSTIKLGDADLISVFLSDSVSVPVDDPDREKADAIQQIGVPNVLDRASVLLRGTVTADEIGKSVRTETAPDSDIIRVIATRKDPAEAKAVANANVNGFIAQRAALTRDQIVAAKVTITKKLAEATVTDRTSPEAQALRERLRRVGVLGEISTGNVTVIQGARKAKTPVSPRPKRAAALGLVAGLLLGLGIAVLRARLDDRIRDADELTEHWPLPVAGLIPRTNSLKEPGRGLPDPAALEAVALTRTNLRYLHVGGDRTAILITSALENEGKSTVTWNLAVAAALASVSVAVVEADLRRPRLSARVHVPGDGLSEVLAGIRTIDEVIHTVAIDGTNPAVTVDVIAAGATPPSPIALLEGDAMADTLNALRSRYDLVLIDSPPATVVGDAVAMARAVDGLVIVSRLGVVRRGAFPRMRDIFVSADAPVVAQIVNGGEASRSYGYYSAYTTPQPAPAPAASTAEKAST
jgi:capsular exopolysaccharide synthesis family protein